ncbi:MAG: substrate-binding domain-containing protein [Drouetiella hepatica Uher 2000/2452]|jgi:ABC-type molybdate transport system substrate-binding protein|uniref:Substrate-binding domain-containing protein n=1 Tax=Drouetiella hepatica Uher 2000/2452 TaxID=904376 RepID=A0A951QAM9_9CYAN|nr:substrate-binding domain-containing protein [Drouetiella hepatica Uher 2000/2452]
MKRTQSRLTRRAFLSSLIFLTGLGLAYAPIPGLSQTIAIVSGTELQEPLQALEAKFEQAHPDIQIELKFQGSQDIVNNYIDDKNEFTPAVLIPANGESLTELEERWLAQNSEPPFYGAPQPIVKSILVGIAWSDRGKVLFPNGRFDWQQLESALQKGNWSAIGGDKSWGSIDLVLTDPTRSNSGQLAMGLWAGSRGAGSSTLNSSVLSSPAIASLFKLAKQSVYNPPRSTDTLLQEFITRGPNDADVAVVYESIALHRWKQSTTTQGKPYQIYYIDPTIETVSTAAIAKRNVSQGAANAAQQFLEFLKQPEQQAVFVQYGFRPVNPSVDLRSIPNSPWNQNIPGAEVNPPGVQPTPDRNTLDEIIRLWQRG